MGTPSIKYLLYSTFFFLCLFAMIWLVVVLTTSALALPGYRLPDNIRPEHYVLEITTNLDEPNFNFTGEVWIKISVKQPTSSIILHAKNLNITESGTTVKEIVSEDELKQVAVKEHRAVGENEFLVVKLDQDLKSGKMYILHLSFAGLITGDLSGYYRSSYLDRQTNTTKWLAVTQFEPTDARKAFPCFDEPEMKAKFLVRLAHKKNFKAVSNMPLAKTVPFEGREDWVWSHFENSVPMSTYLVAYMVSDFDYKQSPPLSNNVTFRIWSRPEAQSQAVFASEVGPKVLQFFENYFNVAYPLPKQDMAAIPDFSAGAMENWGLITYRETALLYDEEVSSKTAQHSIAYVIAHELAHQWFGNLVTMKWWTDLWLNEGFATYVGTLGVEKLFPEWNYLKESVLEFVRVVYDLDSLKSSHPVSKVIGHPAEINQIFDTISYKKGCSILRMMHLFLGESFRTGVTSYLQKHKYSNAEQDDLWRSLTDAAHQDGSLPQEISVKEVMDTWTLQTGYPLVTVTRDYDGGTAKLTQKRYLQVRPEGKDVGSPANETSCWWIPITYTTQKEADFNRTSPKEWMNCDQRKEIEIKGLDSQSWLLLNLQISGLYRVLYDEQNWQLLTKTLTSDSYSEIPAMNRADILMSAFDLARTGDIPYSTAVALSTYLVRETEYLPWKIAFGEFAALSRLMKRTPNYVNFKEFVTKLITPVYNKFAQLAQIPDGHEQMKLHTSVNKWAVSLEMGDSVSQVRELFNKWMAAPEPDKNNPVPRDLRGTVYCNAISSGGPKSWDFLLTRYKQSNVGTEKNTILHSLACSRDIWVLNRYLEWSIKDDSPIRKQDSSFVFTSIARSDIGYYVACDFLQRRIDDIYKYHKGKTDRLGRYLDACANNIIFEDELEKWKRFVAKHKDYLKQSQLAVDQSIESALSNTRWYNKNYETVSKLLSL